MSLILNDSHAHISHLIQMPLYWSTGWKLGWHILSVTDHYLLIKAFSYYLTSQNENWARERRNFMHRFLGHSAFIIMSSGFSIICKSVMSLANDQFSKVHSAELGFGASIAFMGVRLLHTIHACLIIMQMSVVEKSRIGNAFYLASDFTWVSWLKILKLHDRLHNQVTEVRPSLRKKHRLLVTYQALPFT